MFTRAAPAFDNLFMGCVFNINTVHKTVGKLRGSVPKNGPIDFASKNHFSLNSADGKGLIPKC